jgi:hypothetical protein
MNLHMSLNNQYYTGMKAPHNFHHRSGINTYDYHRNEVQVKIQFIEINSDVYNSK